VEDHDKIQCKLEETWFGKHKITDNVARFNRANEEYQIIT